MRRNREKRVRINPSYEPSVLPDEKEEKPKKVRVRVKEVLPLRSKSARISARKNKGDEHEKEHAAKSPEASSSEKDVSSKTIDVFLTEKKPADAPVAKQYVPSLENILLLDVAEGEIEEPELEQIGEFSLEGLFPANTTYLVLPESIAEMPREQVEEIVEEISPEMEPYKSNLPPLELETVAARKDDPALTLYREVLAHNNTSIRAYGLFQAPLQKIRGDLKAISSRSTFEEYTQMIVDLLSYQYSAFFLIKTLKLSVNSAYFNILVELTEFFSNGLDRRLSNNDSLSQEEMAFLSQLNAKLHLVKTSAILSLEEKSFYFFVVTSAWLQSHDKHNPEAIKSFLLLAKHFSNGLTESLAEKYNGNIKGPSL